MCIEVKEFETFTLKTVDNRIIILPQNYLTTNEAEYSSTTISFYKYATEKVPISYFSEPEILVEQRASDWFGPILLFTSVVIIENPSIVNISLKLIEDYLKNYFKGENKPTIRLKVLYKETRTTKTTEISYEGEMEGLEKLEKSIYKVVESSSKSE